jgi:ubiquinone/menaquinone biosynthesis C-methylase UbiE
MFHPRGPTFCELARQCLSSTEQGYNLLAPKFDYTPFRTPHVILKVIQKHLKQYTPIDSALDICCGTGAVMQILRPLCRAYVVGIDFSRGMLEVARKKTETTEGDAELEFVHGNVLNMPFYAEFDMAVCLSAHGHILAKDKTRFVNQVASALKSGGRFVFVTSYRPPVWSKRFWFCHTFNVVMALRNLLIRPPFIMYYLTFLLPEVKTLLENHGFEVEVKKAFDGKLSHLRLVIATLRTTR